MCNFFSSEAPKMAPNSNQPEMSDLPDLEKLGQESESKSQTPAQPVTINAAIKLEGEVSENCALADTRVPSPGDVPKSQSPTQAGQSPSSSGDINPLNVQMPPNFKLPPNFQLPPNSVDLPGNNLQSLLSMCSKMPVLNNMLASSSNPAVFLVAISTALSTLTKPNASEGALSANGGAGGAVELPLTWRNFSPWSQSLGRSNFRNWPWVPSWNRVSCHHHAAASPQTVIRPPPFRAAITRRICRTSPPSRENSLRERPPSAGSQPPNAAPDDQKRVQPGCRQKHRVLLLLGSSRQPQVRPPTTTAAEVPLQLCQSDGRR